jgi:acetyl-CoA C-acetyltransferase
VQQLVVTGGVEQMSALPSIADPSFLDCGNRHLRTLRQQTHQGICADMIATVGGITRAELDDFAYHSQQRAGAAIESGAFAHSNVPVFHDDGQLALDREQYPRPSTTRAALAELKPFFAQMMDLPLDDDGLTYRKILAARFGDLALTHVHHAGNSSGIVDGAAAVVLATPDYARAHGLKPRARIRAIATVGSSPEYMLDGPADAARKALETAGMTIDDIDLVEINEAFAVVPVKFMRELGIDHSKVNVAGGSIALGHPLGATGAILIGTLLDELERRDLTTGLATLCSAGGMAPCAIIERF